MSWHEPGSQMSEPTELATSGAGEAVTLSNLTNLPSGWVSWLDIPYKYYINNGLVWERRVPVVILMPRTRDSAFAR